ncbi:MAG TPA: c-type cytochrome domain-containing protein, partial [Vicinamibacterales bacterium]|nr:c-type cytochrome domain-containing protein [Vicinamibacterales bacterium]
MKVRQIPLLALSSTVVVLVAVGTHRVVSAQKPPEPPPTAAAIEFFEAKVRPILATYCQECHGKKDEGGLKLNSREAILLGGNSGPAIAPGDPDKSLLMDAVRRVSPSLQMPQNGPKLSDADIATLAEWIKIGAPFPASAAAPPPAPDKPITGEQRAFWSFVPIHAGAPPAVKNSDWAKTDIDR